jgi:pilus assembly protein CpaB
MRRKRLVLLILAALLSGLAAAYIALNYLGSQRPIVATPQRTEVRMAVAVRDLALGAVVQAEDIRLVDWPGKQLPEGYFANIDEVAGRALVRPVSMNEPFLRAKLADRDAKGLPIIIPEGMRGMSVRADEVVGVAGYVLPGMRVDVLVTISPPGDQQKLTRVILQNIQVLTAGQTMEQNAEGKPMTVTVITLLVTPEQAEVLALAANEGRVQLALRGVLDMEEVSTPGVRVANLIGTAAAPNPAIRPRARVPVPEQERPTIVELFKGGVRTLTTFKD